MTTLPNSLIPANDMQRLRTLHQFQLINTTPEPIFDEYVALTAQLFNLPISLLSLVDEQEVFFKANTGLPGLERVARPDSLCSAAILQDDVLSFPDLSAQGCGLINPEVAESAGLRFYAGVPLRMADGANIGSLCVIGREARQIVPAEEMLLREISALVCLTIELRAAYLLRGRPDEWEQAQQKLEALLHENTAFARYITSRMGTISVSEQEAALVSGRLEEMRKVLRRMLAEAKI